MISDRTYRIKDKVISVPYRTNKIILELLFLLLCCVTGVIAKKAIFADLAVFHLPVSVLSVYLLVAALSGAVCGYMAGVLIDRAEKYKGRNRNESEKCRKADFAKQALSYFYDSMDYVFREGFGTESKTAEKTRNGIFGLLFRKGEE